MTAPPPPRENAIGLMARPLAAGTRPRSDKATIKAAQGGSADAMNELVRRHWPRAYATALAMLGRPSAASDVAQEAMIAAIRKLNTFDAHRPIEPWLNRITVNQALDFLRQERRRSEVGPVETGTPGGNDPYDRLELVEALQSIDPDARAMVVLKHLGGFTSAEIAEQFGSTPGSVRSTISRALKDLNSYPSDEGENDE